jgi:ketosteroid isomerase-like protein
MRGSRACARVVTRLAILDTVATPNVELANEAIGAMNRGDVDWLIAHSDPEVELHMYGVAGAPVLYVGAAGIRDYFRDMAEIWELLEFSLEDIRDLGDRVFVVLGQRFRGRGSGAEVANTTAAVFRLRAGVVTEMRAYLDVADALAAAGLDR